MGQDSPKHDADRSILEANIRTDLVDAHRGVAAAAARAGTWWTGAERHAIASEVRRALANADLPPWQAPSVSEPGHPAAIPADHPLPAAAVDAIWRITNHPGTLTEDWYRGIVADLPSGEHYVELVELVAMVNSIDRFAAVMDLDPVPLPDPEPGEPTRQRIDGTEVRTHWVPTAPVGGPNVLKALSAIPIEGTTRQALFDSQYLPGGALLGDLDWGRDTIDRRQIELVAAQTSLVNECFY
ncbi:MAG: alkylhydroperoxidase-related (seleno)protein [Actinomycetota bacterium]